MLIVPTILAEQRVAADDNENEGITHLKGGVVFNFMDPLAWSDIGYEGGAFLLVDLTRIGRFIDFDKGIISPYASYEAGAFLTARTLPVTIDGEATVIGIAGEDWFYEESEGMPVVMPYKVQLTNVLLNVSHPFGRILRGQLFAGYDRYDVALDMDEAYGLGVFPYNLSKGSRIGAMASFRTQARNSRSNISPLGLAGKLQYNLWQQRSLKEENSFSIEASGMKEQYDDYLFHLINGRFLLGMPFPVYPKHDLHFSVGGSYLKTINNHDIPTFYYPIARVPGYSYFYKDDKIKIEYGDTSTIRYDTVLVTGKAVLTGEFSYRFPLWPKSIDKKFWFLYLDLLYGALNFSGGAGFDNPMDALDFNRSDWFLSYGAEVRLETISFSNYPMAFKFRWDYGADRATPETFVDNRPVTLGGHRFEFSLGFGFDNDWGMISVVDYFSPARFKSTPAFRLGK
jgi:hypothetical protein